MEPVPYVMISVDRNEQTTEEQAMAMLIHEAGHMTGEKDHLFLDKVGVNLVAALLMPKLLTAEAETTDIVANIFAAKADCEAGTSTQAEIVKKEALIALLQQCSNRHLSCDPGLVQYIFRGDDHFTPGQGFDMKVTCRAEAALAFSH